MIDSKSIEKIDSRSNKMIDKVFAFCENKLPNNELAQLYEWVNKSERNKILFAQIKSYYAHKEITTAVRSSRVERERLISEIYESQGWYRRVSFKPNIAPVVVQLAMLLMVVGAIFYGMNRYNRIEKEKSAAIYLATNVKSANKKAILTLSDGQEMVLGVKEAISERHNKSKSEKFDVEDDGSIVKINERTEKASNRITKQKSTDAQKINIISTSLGGYYNAILPDGSEVWINSKSTLSFSDNFGVGQRKVSLSGEAYFSVKKMDGVPFIVEVGGRSVKVLGTEFNVKAYKEETSLKLSLVNGAVEFKDFATGYTHNLTPNRELVFDFLTGKAVERDFEPYVYGAWKDGYFLFVDSNLEEIVQMISRWFDITIRLDDAGDYNSKLFNGKVSREQGIMPIMSKLQLSYKFRYYMEEDILIIK